MKKLLYKYRDFILPFTIFVVAFILFTIVIFMTEDDITMLQTIYFCFVTATTVGYGDISPSTPIGKVASVIFMLISIGTLASCISTISAITMNNMSQRNKGKGVNMNDLDLLIIGYPSDTKVRTVVTEFRNDERYKDSTICLLTKQLDMRHAWFEDVQLEFVSGIASDRQILSDCCGIETVKKILILANDPQDESSDDFATSAISMIKHLNPDVLIIAEKVRNDSTMFEIEQCDVIVDISSAEMLVQELQDGGAVALAKTIFSNSVDGTQRNIVNEDFGIWEDVVAKLCRNDMTALGYKNPEDKGFTFTPKHSDVIREGAEIKCIMM